MRKASLLVAALTLLSMPLRAQDYCPAEGFPSDVLDALVQHAFLQLVTRLPVGTTGNYATLNIKDAELALTTSAFVGRRVVLGGELHGGITEGLVSVFSSSKLSSKVGLEVELSYLTSDATGIFDLEDCSAYYRRLNALRGDSAVRAVEAAGAMPLTLTILALSRADSLAAALTARLDSTSGARRDSVRVAIQSVGVRRLALQRDSIAQAQFAAADRLKQVRDWYVSEARGLQDSVALAGFEVGWISAGYGGTNTGFRLFDPSGPLDGQVSKHDFLTHSAVLKYSRFRHDPGAFQSFYWSFGGELSIADNLGSLAKVGITETRTFGTDSNERAAEIEYAAYEGEYRKDLKALRVFYDYYRFLFAGNSSAVHVFPAHVMKEHEKPTTELGLGFLMSFAASDKPTDSVHAEVFLNLKDLFDVGNNDAGRLKRSDIGVLVSFPINFPR